MTGREDHGLLVSGAPEAIAPVAKVLRVLARQPDLDERIIGLMIRGVEPARVDPDKMKRLRLRAEARQRFLVDVPLLTRRQVGALLGAKARDRSGATERLEREGRLFAVRHRGVDRFPAFQIVDGAPHPSIAGVLEAFAGEASWTIALWFHSPCGWLGGVQPMDLLQPGSDPERIVEAARQTMNPYAF